MLDKVNNQIKISRVMTYYDVHNCNVSVHPLEIKVKRNVYLACVKLDTPAVIGYS